MDGTTATFKDITKIFANNRLKKKTPFPLHITGSKFSCCKKEQTCLGHK